MFPLGMQSRKSKRGRNKEQKFAILRAQETGAAERTLDRKAESFDEEGMISLFASKPRKHPQETARSLPPDMRQFIVDLRVELPTMSLREIAEISCHGPRHTFATNKAARDMNAY
jgi:hypothetical protein